MRISQYFYYMKDAIIVGGGIAGTTLAWQWHLQGKDIMWFADDRKASSHVAAGVFNPVVLKRFSPVWQAQEQLEVLYPFYTQVEGYLDTSIIHLTPIWRRLHDDREKTTWIRKSQRDDLAPFMNKHTIHEDVDGIHAPCGYGLVNHTGWLDTLAYMQNSINYFKRRQELLQERFQYDSLEILDDGIRYQGIEARHIIFAEGMAIAKNPWLNHLPMQGNKGEVLIIKCPGLELQQIVKSSVFLMPYKDDQFWVGATYSREFDDDQPTITSREYLLEKLRTFLELPFTIIEQKSSIRPTTVDRRPFVGTHHKYERLHCFNGMGSRASLVAPLASHMLYNAIYNGRILPVEMDIARFNS